MKAPTVHGDVAIIGVACTYPGARTALQFWQNIINKFSAIADLEKSRWDTAPFYDPDPSKQDKLYFKKLGVLGTTFTFNPLKLGIPPNTVDGSEPDHFLVLRATYEALVDSGYDHKPFSRERTSLILGKGNYINPGTSWLTMRTAVTESVMEVAKSLRPDLSSEQLARLRDVIREKMPRLSAENAAGLIPNIVTGRVANRLDFMGRNCTIDAACASSLLAMEDAIHSLLTYKDDMVFTGGAHISTNVPFLSIFHATRAMSQTSVIRPFDASADGTMAGEGVGVLVLKRLEDAESDGDRIYAVVKGAGSASDGKAKGLLAPRVEGEELALQRAYQMSQISPSTVGLIEGHGTATPAGDSVELEALRRVFGPSENGRRTCGIGSVKSNIGHAMPAAGAAGLIKTALALYHRVLPPTLNVREPHALLREPDTRFYVNSEARPWIQSSQLAPRRAAVNAFGFGGINGHVVLEEHSGPDEMTQTSLLREWEQELFVFEADSRAGLLAQMDHVRAYAATAETVELRDLAFTLHTRLTGLAQRLAIVAHSFADLVSKIDRVRPRLSDPNVHQIRERTGLYFFDSEELRNGKVGVMFPGEGSQYLNMLRDLCLHFPPARQIFDLADSAADPSAVPLSEVLFPPPTFSAAEEAEAEAKLWSIERATEAVLTADGAIYKLLDLLGLKPALFTGHSAGEWVAMAVSGMIDLEEFIASMPRLAAMYEKVAADTEIPKMAMLAVGAGRDRVETLAREIGVDIRIANDNCPHQVVIVVEPAEAARVTEHLLTNGVFCEHLPYDRGYHTPAFTYICDPLREFFGQFNLRKPTVPVISCTTASDYGALEPSQIVEAAAETFALPLNFQDTIERMYADGVRIFVESGPRANLTSFVDDILRGRPHLAVPMDQFRRPGILSLQHAVGMLFAAHQPLDLGLLYARRAPRLLTLDVQKDFVLPEERELGARQISLCYDEFSAPAPGDFALAVAPALLTAPAASPQVSAAFAAPPEPPVLTPPAAAFTPAPPVHEPEPVFAGLASAPAFLAPEVFRPVPRSVLDDHLSLMDQFLETEEQVLTSLFGGGGRNGHSGFNGGSNGGSSIGHVDPGFTDSGYADSGYADASYADTSSAQAPPASYPLLADCEVLEEVPGQSATIRVRLDLAEHRYLLDHVLSRQTSERAVPGPRKANMPLTGSIELLCEAAAKWFGLGRLVVGVQKVSAMRPIFVEEGQPPADILVMLRALDASRVVATIRSPAKETFCEATILLGDAYPPAAGIAPLAVPLVNPRTPICTGYDVYTSNRMFHGPSFHCIHAIHSIGENGLTAQLKVLPNDQGLRSDSAPQYLIDPFVFDAAGQLVGYWPIEYFDVGMMVLPIRIADVIRYAPTPPAGTVVEVVLVIRDVKERQFRADYDVILPDGTLWLRVEGWEDWRFHFDRRFYEFFRVPERNLMGRPCSSPLLEQHGIRCEVIDCLPDLGKPGLYEIIWTTSLLSASERARYLTVAGERERGSWLNRSGAAKDIVRAWGQHKGRQLCPADIEIEFAEDGAVRASGFWEAEVGVPRVAVSYEGKICVAVAADGPLAVAAERIVPDAAAPENGFVPEEQAWLARLGDPAEWVARAIAAKKAVARYLRPDTPENAEFWMSLLIPKLEEASGELAVADPASAVNAEDVIRVFTLRDGDWALAVATE